MARDHEPGPTTMDGRYTLTATGNRRRSSKPTPAQLRRVRSEVFRRDSFTCQECGVRGQPERGWDGSRTVYTRQGKPLHLDHITPYRDGGPFSTENLRTLCESCNCRRGVDT